MALPRGFSGRDGATLGLGLAVAATGCAGRDVGGLDASGSESDAAGDGDTGPLPDNGIPLELVLAQFDPSLEFVLLRFSEPMAAVDGIDPADFRLSFTSTSRYLYEGTVYAFTYYADVHYMLVYNYVAYTEFVPLVFDEIANGALATDIVLRFAEPLDSRTCWHYGEVEAYAQELDQEPDNDARVGLFPHYSPGAVPVQSADGQSLAAIGAHWVEHGSPFIFEEQEFGWPYLDPQVAFPCDVGYFP